MKEPNKYQLKALRDKAKLIASGELNRIADSAIADATRIAAKATYVVDASEQLASANAMNRHVGAMMHDAVLNPKNVAVATLTEAARGIYKLVKDGGEAAWNAAQVEIAKIEAARAELGLIEVEAEEAE